MIVEAIRKFIEYQQRVRIYSDEYREYDQAVAGNVTARHYRNKKNWSGPQEYLVCKKREAYRKMIRACDQYRKYHDALRQHLKDVPSDTLRRIIWLRFYYSKSWEDIGRRVHASGMDDVTVYKKANIDRKVFSRIRCKEDYKPKKKTAVAFAIALELDLPTTLDLLLRAEIAFSPSSRFDLIVTYFITNKIYDIYKINTALFKYGQPILGE